MNVHKFILYVFVFVVFVNEETCTQGAPWEKQTCAFFCPMIVGNLLAGSLGALCAAPVSVAASIVLDKYYESNKRRQIKTEDDTFIKEKKKDV